SCLQAPETRATVEARMARENGAFVRGMAGILLGPMGAQTPRPLSSSAMLERFRKSGFVILESVLTAAERAELVAALAPFEDAQKTGRNNFEGERSKRVYALAGKGEVFMRLAEHPAILSLVDELLLPNWLLSTM